MRCPSLHWISDGLPTPPWLPAEFPSLMFPSIVATAFPACSRRFPLCHAGLKGRLFSVDPAFHTENERIFLLPPKPAALLRRFLSKESFDVCVKFNDNAAQFVGGNWQLTCRLIDGRYPNYDSIIPTDNDKTMLIDFKTNPTCRKNPLQFLGIFRIFVPHAKKIHDCKRGWFCLKWKGGFNKKLSPSD